MNITTKDKIKVMQAYEDGKTVLMSVKDSGDRIVCKDADWDWVHYTYIVKEDADAASEKYAELGLKSTARVINIHSEDTQYVLMPEYMHRTLKYAFIAGVEWVRENEDV